ncbi:MAG: hypothetical protein ACREJP_07715 [Candidatus Methylomirabilales bacterium]
MKIVRDTAVKVQSQAMITLKATLVTGSEELRAELKPLTDFALVAACASFESADDISDPGDAMRHVLGSLARRWLELHEEIKVHTRHLKALTAAAPRTGSVRAASRPLAPGYPRARVDRLDDL